MADGGASNMILLVTALLICGAASGILLQSWSQTATSVGINQEQLALNSKTKISFSGDLGKASCDAVSDQITIYVQNSGSSILDENEFGAFVDGTFVSLVGVPTFLNGATIWNSGVVVEFTLQSGTSILCDGTEEKRITVVVGTTTSGGVSGSDSITEVVKLG
jgi:archaellum component FlaG (FlaF/FlaG flagellin family)